MFWFVLIVVFFAHSNNLLLSLLVLEILSFFLMFGIIVSLSSLFSLDFFIVCLFCVFVIEGVIALSGLIMLVSFTGSDYVSSLSFLKL